MSVRGILPTERPDDIPYAVWAKLYVGALEAFNREAAKLGILLVVRPMRRLGRWWRWFRAPD